MVLIATVAPSVRPPSVIEYWNECSALAAPLKVKVTAPPDREAVPPTGLLIPLMLWMLANRSLAISTSTGRTMVEPAARVWLVRIRSSRASTRYTSSTCVPAAASPSRSMTV